MTYSEFKASLSGSTPPAALSVYLKALWFDAKNNWHVAHQLIQDLPDATAALIHAYLHRKDGDKWNANYWYTRANEEFPKSSAEDEWERLVKRLL